MFSDFLNGGHLHTLNYGFLKNKTQSNIFLLQLQSAHTFMTFQLGSEKNLHITQLAVLDFLTVYNCEESGKVKYNQSSSSQAISA